MKFAALALAGCLALAGVTPTLAQESDGVPFLDEAQENYSVAFSTAMRLLDSQGLEAVQLEVNQCYANIEPHERIRRTQYCFLYDVASVVTSEMLQAALAGRMDGKLKGAQLDPAARRAVGSLIHAGFSDRDAVTYVRAWLMTGKAGVTSAQAREFAQLVQRRGGGLKPATR